MSKQFEIK
jgi:hypothetical protein